MRHVVPESMGGSPDNATHAISLHQLQAIYHALSLTVSEAIEGDRLCMFLSARANTWVSLNGNGYVLSLGLDEIGIRVFRTKKYPDTPMLNRSCRLLYRHSRGERAYLLFWSKDDSVGLLIRHVKLHDVLWLKLHFGFSSDDSRNANAFSR